MAVAAPAKAVDRYLNYDCGIIEPQHWCMFTQAHAYESNEAYWSNSYPQGQHIYMCSKLIQPNANPEYQYDRTCAWAVYVYAVSSGFGRAPYPNGTVLMYPLVANGGNPSAHIIYGNAEY
jgi:hypothetical protein